MEQQSELGTARGYFAWGAILLLLISLALPVVQMPFIGAQNVFSLSDRTAYLFLGCAVLSGVATFFKRYRLLAIPGLIVLATTLYYVYHFNAIKHDVTKQLQGNIFGSLAQGMLSTIRLQYGIAVILIAGAALVTASFLTRDSATLPGVIAANRRAFVGGAIGLAVLLLLVALAPKIFPAGDVAGAAGGGSNNLFSSTPEPFATSAAVPKMKRALTVGLLAKTFHKADPARYVYAEHFVLTEQYHNVGTKTIVGVKGTLAVFDQLGDRRSRGCASCGSPIS